MLMQATLATILVAAGGFSSDPLVALPPGQSEERSRLIWEAYILYKELTNFYVLHESRVEPTLSSLESLLEGHVSGAKRLLSWSHLGAFYQYIKEWAPLLLANFLGQETGEKEVSTVCSDLPHFLDALFEQAVSAGGEELLQLLDIHSLASQALYHSSCCREVVERQFVPVMQARMDPSTPWHEQVQAMDPEEAQFWRCIEWVFWADSDGRIREGLRGHLWEKALHEGDAQIYGVFEALTLQLAAMPLCLHRTLAMGARAQRDRSTFFSFYEHCMPLHIRYAIDHLTLAGEPQRVQEAFSVALSLQRSYPEIHTLNWNDIRCTGHNLVPVASWPWWQTHPVVARYVHFLEQYADIFASERANVERHPELQQDAYTSTSRGLSWRSFGFYPFEDEKCAMAPKTCQVLRSLSWTDEGNIIWRKMDWNIVNPGRRLGGHTGQALRINVQLCVHGCEGATLELAGGIHQYRTGKAFAWQDSWHHEVVNHGPEPRWCFMITIVHPELEEAHLRSGGEWPDTYDLLTKEENHISTLAQIQRASGPLDKRW